MTNNAHRRIVAFKSPDVSKWKIWCIIYELSDNDADVALDVLEESGVAAMLDFVDHVPHPYAGAATGRVPWYL